MLCLLGTHRWGDVGHSFPSPGALGVSPQLMNRHGREGRIRPDPPGSSEPLAGPTPRAKGMQGGWRGKVIAAECGDCVNGCSRVREDYRRPVFPAHAAIAAENHRPTPRPSATRLME